jgi:hypothetical protein
LTDETRRSPTETVSHSTPQQQLDFLAGEVRKALACFDRMPMQQYFDQVERQDPIALAVLGAFDHLSPALNVLGLTNEPLSDSHLSEREQ